MLLTQTRRFATTALVKIVSICRSASPESPLAWRSRTLVWRKCLSLLDCIKSVFPTGRRLRRLARAFQLARLAGVDRPPRATRLVTGSQDSAYSGHSRMRRWNQAGRPTAERPPSGPKRDAACSTGADLSLTHLKCAKVA